MSHGSAAAALAARIVSGAAGGSRGAPGAPAGGAPTPPSALFAPSPPPGAHAGASSAAPPALDAALGERLFADPQAQQQSTKNLYLTDTPESAKALADLFEKRLDEGCGEFVLEVGLDDNGSSWQLTAEDYVKVLATCDRAATQLGAHMSILHERDTPVLATSNSATLAAAQSGSSTSNVPTKSRDTKSGGPLPPLPSASSSSLGSASNTSALGPRNSGVGKSDPAPSSSLKPQTGYDNEGPSFSSPYRFAHLLIRRKPGIVENLLEIRIACTGNVDAGKSTLLGVLTKGVLDDGRGRARVNLFRHKHEIESGRTSSIGCEIMGYDARGFVVTPQLINKQKLQWEDICVNASKVISFVDLAGHAKYLKTTVAGLSSHAVDYCQLMVGANAGIIGSCREHLGLCVALSIPVYVVISKVDMTPPNVLETTIKQLTKLLKSPGCRKVPVFINSVEDVLTCVNNFVSERICPIFQVSNVTGYNLHLLRLFLNLIHSAPSKKYNSKESVEFQITDTFSVPGVGTVVAGVCVAGVVHQGDQLFLGPDSTGQFVPTMVKSIQRKRVNVPCVSAGQSASFALKKIKRSQIRKGMVLLSAKSPDMHACIEFECDVLILFHSTTIGLGYQAMVHCGCVRQTARIVGIETNDENRNVLRTGDRAKCRFAFLQYPEFIKPGMKLLFREGRCKGLGTVSKVFPQEK